MRGATCVLILALVFPLSFPAMASFHDPSEYPYGMEWRAPTDSTGNIVIQYTVDYGDDNECLRMDEMAAENPDDSLYFMMASDRGSFSAGWSSQLVHAHVDDIDTHTVTGGASGGFGLRTSSLGPVSGTETKTTAVFGATSFDFGGDPWGPVAFEIACKNPVSVSGFAGSTEAFGFTEQDFDGTSASVQAIFASASVNLGSLEGTFTSGSVQANVLETGSQAGELRFTHADGETHHDLGGGFGVYAETGPGGDWSVGLDRIALGGGFIVGFVGGVDPVDDLDEIF